LQFPHLPPLIYVFLEIISQQQLQWCEGSEGGYYEHYRLGLTCVSQRLKVKEYQKVNDESNVDRKASNPMNARIGQVGSENGNLNRPQCTS